MLIIKAGVGFFEEYKADRVASFGILWFARDYMHLPYDTVRLSS